MRGYRAKHIHVYRNFIQHNLSVASLLDAIFFPLSVCACFCARI